jgi:hypothetical protein
MESSPARARCKITALLRHFSAQLIDGLVGTLLGCVEMYLINYCAVTSLKKVAVIGQPRLMAVFFKLPRIGPIGIN